MSEMKSIGAAYSKAARRKRKKGGKRAMESAQEEYTRIATVVERDDPLSVVREARGRITGITSDNLAPILGDAAGVAIHLEAPDDSARLWDVFKRYCAAMSSYSQLVLGRSMFPASSKIEFMPERFETRPDDVIDTRTHDERIRDCRNRMDDWRVMLDKLYPWQRMAIERAARQQETLHINGEVTSAGRSFVAAIRRLSDVERKQ